MANERNKKPNIRRKQYNLTDKDYRENVSRDEFQGRKAQQARSRAMKAAKQENSGKITKEQRDKIKGDTPISFVGRSDGEGSQFYGENAKGKRVLKDMSEGSPFEVDKLEDFDLAAYGVGAASGNEVLSVNDLRGLRDQGGFGVRELNEYRL